MKRLLELVRRRPKLIVVVGSICVGLIWLFAYSLRVYEWDLRIPSPDGKYDIVVLRSDLSAIDDFRWDIYVFPHSVVPSDQPRYSPLTLTLPWLGDRYLVYSGYDYPLIRWVDSKNIEIDLHEVQYSPFKIEHIKRFESAKLMRNLIQPCGEEHDKSGNIVPHEPCPIIEDDAITVSVVFAQEDPDIRKAKSKYVFP